MSFFLHQCIFSRMFVSDKITKKKPKFHFPRSLADRNREFCHLLLRGKTRKQRLKSFEAITKVNNCHVSPHVKSLQGIFVYWFSKPPRNASTFQATRVFFAVKRLSGTCGFVQLIATITSQGFVLLSFLFAFSPNDVATLIHTSLRSKYLRMLSENDRSIFYLRPIENVRRFIGNV